MGRRTQGFLTTTRRGLFRAGVATGIAVASIGVLAGCKHKDDGSTRPTVVDGGSADYVIDPSTNESNYSSAELSLKETGSWTIAVGNVLKPSEGSLVAATTAGSSAAPMVKASTFSISSGAISELVTEPVADDKGNVVIYDVGCSDSVYAWVELDLLTHDWALYATALSSGKLAGDPTSLWSAGADWDPASFVVSGKMVIWQVMPSNSGSRRSEHSYCYLWTVGDSSTTTAVDSPGRFGTAPTVSDGIVTLTPRVNADAGTYYGITAYGLSDGMGSQIDQLVLPSEVKPFSAVRMGDDFAFSIEANYSSGGLLGQMGTYIGHGEGPFVALSREPSAPVAGKGSVYIVRANASYFVIDTDARTYATLPAANRALDYGEYPVRAGTCDTFVTYATVKTQDTGYPESVSVRAFAL